MFYNTHTEIISTKCKIDEDKCAADSIFALFSAFLRGPFFAPIPSRKIGINSGELFEVSNFIEVKNISKVGHPSPFRSKVFCHTDAGRISTKCFLPPSPKGELFGVSDFIEVKNISRVEH